MKRKLALFLIFFISLILILYVPISYALDIKYEMDNMDESQKSQFLEVDSTEKTIGSTLNMYINLSAIDYTTFKFILDADIDIEDIDDSDLNNNEIELKEDEDEFYIIVNKSDVDINTITLSYIIPDSFNIGDIFTITGKVEEYDEEEKTESEEISIEITIVEDTEETYDDENQENNNEFANMKVEQTTQENINQTNKESNSTSSMSTTNMGVSTTSSTEEAVTYNGSCNNYLSNIEIDGYSLNTEFDKSNNTYFVTVDNSTTNIEITATKEDSSSIVCIYGNDDLDEGTNKILISVTAENGNVRNYRIFVTRESA